MTYAPTLETARLTLRPHHVDDYAACRSLWADAQVEAPSLRCIIHPDNAASIKMAEKLGFAALVDTELAGTPTRVFDRPKAVES